MLDIEVLREQARQFEQLKNAPELLRQAEAQERRQAEIEKTRDAIEMIEARLEVESAPYRERLEAARTRLHNALAELALVENEFLSLGGSLVGLDTLALQLADARTRAGLYDAELQQLRLDEMRRYSEKDFQIEMGHFVKSKGSAELRRIAQLSIARNGNESELGNAVLSSPFWRNVGVRIE